MGFAPAYLFARFFYRVFEFFRHWYVDGSRAIVHRFISSLERLDRELAVRVTLTHFFEPLYGDYTFVGRIWGLVFRPVRILLGLALYALVALAFLAAFLVWLAIPPFIVAYAVRTR